MTRIQVRRDTSANWTKNNPVLASGEPAYETDTGKFKIGDGSKNYTALPYQGGGGGSDTPIATTQVAGKVKPDGTTITITKDGTISSVGGGGLTPDENDRVTLEGINLKQHNLSNPSGSIYASDGNIEIRNRDNAGMFLDSYGGLYKINSQGIQSELIDSSKNPAFTTQVNFFNNDQIIHSNHGLKFGLNQNEPMGSITAAYGTMRLNPDKISSPSAELTIGSSTLTYTDRDGNTHNLLESGGSSEPPANMVTTDTNQVITGEKGFTSAIKIMGSTTDNYYGQIIRPDGNTVRIQPQYGDSAGLNIQTNDVLFIDSRGISHSLLSSGATINDSAASDTSTYSSSKIEKLTNITSSDTSISVTKSDTGVNIVANKDLVTSYSFPSDRYVDLELGASNTKYTAPANGWAYLNFTNVDVNEALNLQCLSGNSLKYFQRVVTPTKTSLSVFIPVQKNNTFIPIYNVKNTTNYTFRFYYAEGSQPQK